MTVSTDKTEKEASTELTNISLSVGSGIAIVGMWLVGAAVTLTLFILVLTNKVFDTSSIPEFDTLSTADAIGLACSLLLFIWVISLPMLAAYWITRCIIGMKD